MCHLKKSLYSLKQVPRAWYSRIDAYFLKNGFKRYPFKHTFYIKEGTQVNQNEDEIFITQNKYAKDLLKRFRMEGAKPISTSMEVGLKLRNSNAQRRDDGTLYRSFVGSLVYLTATRSDTCLR